MNKNKVNVINRVKKWVLRLFTSSVFRWIMENTQFIQFVIDMVMNFII